MPFGDEPGRLRRAPIRVLAGRADRDDDHLAGAALSAVLLTGRSRLRLSVLLGAISLALLSTIAGLLVGPVKLPVTGVLHELAHHLPFLSIGHGLPPTDALILDQLRLPRVVLGLMVGGMLGMAGCAYQGVFRNPLADPYLLGSAAGAGFGATSAIALGATGAIGPVDSLPLAAFVGSLVAVAGTYLLGRSAGEGPGVLVLGGRHGGRVLHGAADVRRSSTPSRTCRRSTRSSSAASRPRAGTTSRSSRPTFRLGGRDADARARARRARARRHGGLEPRRQRAPRRA